MGKFACVIHPLNLDLLATAFEEGLRGKREEIVKKVMEWIPIFKGSDITGLKSKTGKEAEGHLISYTLLPEQILNLDSRFILRRLIKAGELAQELGTKIFGLAAYTAHVGKKGILIAKNLKIPVTTGTSYTIVTVIESIIKAADLVGINLAKAKVTVIGATGSIGSICSQILARSVGNMILVARNKQRLNILANKIHNYSEVNIRTTDNVIDSVRNADIIITSTNSPKILFSIDSVQAGSIVIDISLPRNVSKESADTRKDVLVIDGGIIKPPGEVNFNFYFGLPPGLCYACMAETMILALEERYESYSIGGDISLRKVEEISQLGIKHGFELANLRGFDEDISNEQIKRVSESYQERINNLIKK